MSEKSSEGLSFKKLRDEVKTAISQIDKDKKYGIELARALGRLDGYGDVEIYLKTVFRERIDILKQRSKSGSYKYNIERWKINQGGLDELKNIYKEIFGKEWEG